MRPRKVILTIELMPNVIPITKLRVKSNLRLLVRRMGDIYDPVEIQQVQANVVKKNG
jgi:hypothetical protein